jgi:hypothetical protein
MKRTFYILQIFLFSIVFGQNDNVEKFQFEFEADSIELNVGEKKNSRLNFSMKMEIFPKIHFMYLDRDVLIRIPQNERFYGYCNRNRQGP